MIIVNYIEQISGKDGLVHICRFTDRSINFIRFIIGCKAFIERKKVVE